MTPSVVCLAFSLELYIKDIYYALNLEGELPRGRDGHNILELFRKLPEESRQDIRSYPSIQKIIAFRSMERFPFYIPQDKNKQPITDILEQQIYKISDAFEKWRYSYENGTLTYEDSIALALIEAARSAADNARRQPAAYQRFSPDSVNGSDSTAGLKRNIEKDDNKIIVTTIQKLNNLMKSEGDLDIYNKQVVFIFDECHRSQFGEAQKNLKKKFKRFYQFGFTGTPIFPQNALGAETTASVFGRELHSYVITDAIRDEKVLKFKVDYNDVRPRFKAIESEQDEKKLSAAENKQALQHPERIKEISQYILNNFRQKTHRLQGGNKGFNAMFAVSSVEAAKLYYEALNGLQKGSDKPLKIATIYSFAANEEQEAVGDKFDDSAWPCGFADQR